MAIKNKVFPSSLKDTQETNILPTISGIKVLSSVTHECRCSSDLLGCVCVCVCVSLGTLVFLCSNCRDEQKRREEEKKRGIKRRRERIERRRANERLKVLNRDITDGVYMPLIQPFISSQAAAVWLRRDERFTDLFHFLFPSPQFSVFLL